MNDKTLRWLSILLVFFGACSAFAGTCGSGYSHYRVVTFASTGLSTDQTSFPNLVCINGACANSETVSDFMVTGSGGNVTSSNGYDVVFCDASSAGNQLNHEIDSYSATDGKAAFWVGQTRSHTSSTLAYMFYGNSSVTTSQEHASSLWSAANYVAVYHFGAASLSNPSTTDSSGNGNTLSGGTAPGQAAGMFGGAPSCNGSTHNMSHASPTGVPTGAAARSLEVWEKQAANNFAQSAFGYSTSSSVGDRQRYEISARNNLLYGEYINALTDATVTYNTSWHHVVLTSPSSATVANTKIYVDGTVRTPAITGSGSLNTQAGIITVCTLPVSGGANFWQGNVDEARASTVEETADWIALINSNAAKDYTIGADNPIATAHHRRPSVQY
jgi:hypothetical protein